MNFTVHHALSHFIFFCFFFYTFYRVCYILISHSSCGATNERMAVATFLLLKRHFHSLQQKAVQEVQHLSYFKVAACFVLSLQPTGEKATGTHECVSPHTPPCPQCSGVEGFVGHLGGSVPTTLLFQEPPSQL